MKRDTKSDAIGRWRAILGEYVDDGYLDGKPHPCPLCNAGVDRFTFDDKQGNGTYICRHCGAGTGIHFLSQYHGINHHEAWNLVSRFIGKMDICTKADEKNDKAERVKKILSTCKPVEAGDNVSQYLASRCLTDVPKSVMEGFYGYSIGGTWVECYGMVLKAALGNKCVGVHVTYIRDGQKVDRKMYGVTEGSFKGAAVRLHKLNGGTELVIGEGVESSLSASIITGIPAWSALSASGLEGVQIPEQIKRVVVAADADLSYTGQSAAYNLAKLLVSKKISVEVIVPPMGMDFNDVLKDKHGK